MKTNCSCSLVPVPFLLGCLSPLLAVICIGAGSLHFAPLKANLFSNIHDLMFIDNTKETSFEGPLGKSVSEKEQFDQWKKTAKEVFQQCLQDGGDPHTDCINGLDFEVAIFNVTNAEDVVLHGAKVKLQELEPIFAKKYFDKFDVDAAHWDLTGVARFRQNTTIELDQHRCGVSCRELLKKEVVIPNPAWATISAQGAELAFGIILAAQGLAMQMPPAALKGVATSKFGMSNGTETDVFLHTFFFEANAMLKLATIGAFLQTTVAASATGGTCRMGRLSLPVSTCLKVLTTFQAMIPAAWNATMAMVGPAYNVGIAAPVFIRVTVEQALGFNGKGFTDALTQEVGLTFGTLTSKVDPAGLYREVQMGSKWGVFGTSYYTKYGAASYDCRYDSDCKLTSASLDSCQKSNVCKPRDLEGYAGQALPGKVWGNKRGFQDMLGQGSHINLFYEGSVTPMVSVGARTMQLPSYKDEDGKTLQYADFRLASLQRRVENCDGKGPGSPGFDCKGPASTLNMAPALNSMPFYLSMPHFKNELELEPMQVNSSRTHGGAPYSPSDRANITPCSGNVWCDNLSLEKYSSYLWVEPETGNVIAGMATIQGNIRLASSPMPSIFHPKLHDALVPVYWTREGLIAPVKILSDLATLQNAPSQLSLVIIIFYVSSGILFGIGAFAIFWVVRSQIQASNADELEASESKSADDQTENASQPGHDKLPTLHGQDFSQLAGKAGVKQSAQVEASSS
eukprot:TRINITY_DN48977_c0_g1_i1.p1 TRINITY_DN48977_c0_g1~~TRINITY_DN48977_c0_g1_i1.p1  ORF type:complete len:739 (-),score=133.05 TRINITY_DN48977_c0_g1_i1:46-2262(-)